MPIQLSSAALQELWQACQQSSEGAALWEYLVSNGASPKEIQSGSWDPNYSPEPHLVLFSNSETRASTSSSSRSSRHHHSHSQKHQGLLLPAGGAYATQNMQVVPYGQGGGQQAILGPWVEAFLVRDSRSRYVLWRDAAGNEYFNRPDEWKRQRSDRDKRVFWGSYHQKKNFYSYKDPSS